MSQTTPTSGDAIHGLTEKPVVSESLDSLPPPQSSVDHQSDEKTTALEAQPSSLPDVLENGDEHGAATTFAREQQRWNSPRINTWKLAAVFLTLMNIGANDASYGALIPSLETYYHLNYTVVSLIFLSPFAGYTIAAFTCDRLHLWVGQRGVAVIGPLCRLVSYIIICVHPPWPVVICVLILTGYGNGLLDAAWNAWVGDMSEANQLLGIMHGFYGLGATISPVIVTAMVNTYNLQWYEFFYVMVGMSSCELVAGVWAFWAETASEFQRKNNTSKGGGRTRQAMTSKVTWIVAVFLFVYVGCEVSVAGWVVTFMIRVRHAAPFASGMTATGFWLGVTVGRVTLGFVTAWLGERWAVSVYVVLCIVAQLLFWLVPNFYVSAVMVAILGYFLGPLFPAAIIAITKLLPKQLHVSAIGFCAAVGGCGASVLPFAVGAIAQAAGVSALQPIVLGMLVILLGSWLLLPAIPRLQHQN